MVKHRGLEGNIQDWHSEVSHPEVSCAVELCTEFVQNQNEIVGCKEVPLHKLLLHRR